MLPGRVSTEKVTEKVYIDEAPLVYDPGCTKLNAKSDALT